MNRKQLCVLVALAIGAGAVSAQDYDNRWYIAPALGMSVHDDDRMVDSDLSVLGSIGIGRFVSENSSLDFTLDYTSRSFDNNEAMYGDFDNYALSVAARHYLANWAWRPYVKAGLGLSRAHVTNQLTGNDYSPDNDASTNAVFDGGFGLGHDINDAIALRSELTYRYDMDDESIPSQDHFGDWIASVGLTVKLGERAAPAAAAAADPGTETPVAVTETPAADCSTLDDDKDGVNNCDDQCPASAAGEAVGADGCAAAIVIDLRGVNFAFDKSDLSAESVAILDQAVDVLNRYPALKVEVAGHTDSIGTDSYNQGLSERRAKAVYDYLTGKGIAADRLSGPNGYGEAKPIDTNDTSEGRARNRRTELVKQQ